MHLPRQAHFRDETAAFAYVESLRWPDGPVCPHCGNADRIYALEGVRGHQGAIREGLQKCGACRRQFTVRIGTAFERSHVPLRKWLEAIDIVRTGRQATAAGLGRALGLTYRTAAAMLARLRAAPDPIPVTRPIRQPTYRPVFIVGDIRPLPMHDVPAQWWPMVGTAPVAAEMIFIS
ncbi:MAG: transposase [Bauldia sp.]